MSVTSKYRVREQTPNSYNIESSARYKRMTDATKIGLLTVGLTFSIITSVFLLANNTSLKKELAAKEEAPTCADFGLPIVNGISFNTRSNQLILSCVVAGAKPRAVLPTAPLRNKYNTTDAQQREI